MYLYLNYLIGIFGILVGTDVLVGLKKMNPIQFTVEAKGTTVVLAERTLDMTKDMTRKDLIQAIMVAENRSTSKKPNPINIKNTEKPKSNYLNLN